MAPGATTGAGGGICDPAQPASAATPRIESRTPVQRVIVSPDNSQVDGLLRSRPQAPRHAADLFPSDTTRPAGSPLPLVPTATRSPPSHRTPAPLSRPAARMTAAVARLA